MAEATLLSWGLEKKKKKKCVVPELGIKIIQLKVNLCFSVESNIIVRIKH